MFIKATLIEEKIISMRLSMLRRILTRVKEEAKVYKNGINSKPQAHKTPNEIIKEK